MKWSNRGKQFDEVYENILSKKAFMLFGAGEYGHDFIPLIKDEINIQGIYDSNPAKHGKAICGYICRNSKELKDKSENIGIIVTISQFMRASAVKLLKDFGFKENEDYFFIEKFLSIYYVYKYNKVYMSSISFLPSTFCNLNCRYCLNFNPFAKEKYVRKLDDLKRDVDIYFSAVDRVMIFHLSGGEPLLYPYFSELVEYINDNYGNRIDYFKTVTNCTIIPNEKILNTLAKCKIKITLDDYRDNVELCRKNFDKVLNLMEENGVDYEINKTDSWIDLAPECTDNTPKGQNWLIKHFDECAQTWHELRNGSLYMCNYAAYAAVAGLTGGQDNEEIYDLKNFTEDKKKELVEFRLGYSEKGYTDFCRFCRGFTIENDRVVRPAEQV